MNEEILLKVSGINHYEERIALYVDVVANAAYNVIYEL